MSYCPVSAELAVLSALPACCCPGCPLWVTMPARALLLLLPDFEAVVLSWFHEPSKAEAPALPGLDGEFEPAVLVVSCLQELSDSGEGLLW